MSAKRPSPARPVRLVVSMPSPAALLAMATRFELQAADRDSLAVTLERTRVAAGRPRWVIRCGHLCLNRDASWRTEPQPSDRSEEFIDQTRFTLRQACLLWGRWCIDRVGG